jgi:hypothetical protein
MKIAVTRAKAPVTTIPAMRKGSRMSQIMGYRKRAARARGQQRTRRMQKRRSLSMEFLLESGFAGRRLSCSGCVLL